MNNAMTAKPGISGHTSLQHCMLVLARIQEKLERYPNDPVMRDLMRDFNAQTEVLRQAIGSTAFYCQTEG